MSRKLRIKKAPIYRELNGIHTICSSLRGQSKRATNGRPYKRISNVLVGASIGNPQSSLHSLRGTPRAPAVFYEKLHCLYAAGVNPRPTKTW